MFCLDNASLYKPIKKIRVGDQQEQKFNVPINLDSITFLLSLQYIRLYSFSSLHTDYYNRVDKT